MAPKPEQTFFADPALDRAVGMVMALAGELHVARDRLRCLESCLVAKGVLEPGELDVFEPTAVEAAAMDADRDAFVAELLGCLRGVESSRGAP